MATPSPKNPSPKKKLPKLRRHATGQGVVWLDGKDHYLGAYGTPEAQAKYDRMVGEWIANGRKIIRPSTPGQSVYIAQLLSAFLDHAQRYYVDPDGLPTSEVEVFRHVIALTDRLFGDVRVNDFGPRALETLRQAMIDKGWKRKSINRQVNRVRHIFAWGVLKELVPATIHAALKTLPALRNGRTTAVESDDVAPVALEHVDAVRPFLSRQVNAMIDLQLWSAARPGEVVQMRAIDLHIPTQPAANGEPIVWEYRPPTHKNKYRGHERVIVIGPKAQEVLRPYLNGRPHTAFLFSPIEAEEERKAARRAARRSPVQPSQVERAERANARKGQRQRTPKDHYTTTSYRRAIARACDEADEAARRAEPEAATKGRIVPHWHPHQLRHTAATEIRKKFDLDTAQTVLGHKHSSTTEIYAQPDREKAKEAARVVG